MRFPSRVTPALALLLLGASSGTAQKLDPAKWTLSLEGASVPPGARVVARLTANIETGWRLYSPTTPPGGPIPTSIQLAGNEAIAGFEVRQRPPATKFDPNFQLETETYEHEAVFLILVTVAGDASPGAVDLTARVRYQLCTHKLCLPPVRKTATATLLIDRAAAAAAVSIPPGFVVSVAGAPEPAATQAGPPPAPEPAAPVRDSSADQRGMLGFILVAFGFGVAAIFTPCVFPMIPITVSFFLGRQTGVRRESVIQAAVFCLGIIALFCSLGLAMTAIVGPFGVVRLGASPWVNAFIALVLLAFGLSLLGAFEMSLPSGVLTRLDRSSRRGGYAGTLIMGLTFSLAAFACIGPFVGALLAASVQGGGLRPLLGMLVFAAGLASPFFLLALFPAYLQRMPKSGEWLARVKVVLGFVILAAMFKYLSNVDQAMHWGVLTRERFLAVWIVLFLLAGLYLLGLVRLEGATPDEKVGLGRLLSGAAFLIFAISLLPGMFGGRLGELDAYVPAAGNRSSFVSVETAGAKLAWMKNRYDEALAKAREQGKLLFVNFTGYACTNCRWMKTNMFTRPEVAGALAEFVLLELYTDGADEASRRNQELQQRNFATIAIPYYAIIGPDENVIATFGGITRDSGGFLAFLRGSAPAGANAARPGVNRTRPGAE